MTPPTRNAILIFTLMLMASIGAVLARPEAQISDMRDETTLDAMIPKQVGGWYDEPKWMTQIVDPVLQEAIDQIYDEVLARTYANADGYRIMLSIAYKADHRRSSRIHRPELCYTGEGFAINRVEPHKLSTPFGDIPAVRMLAAKGQRIEPVTYWVTVGDVAVSTGLNVKLTELSYTLKGAIPDGLLFRVSSTDPDEDRARRLQEEFVIQLLSTVPERTRNQLGGFGKN